MRFPTSFMSGGSDAMYFLGPSTLMGFCRYGDGNTEYDYSNASASLYAASDMDGQGVRPSCSSGVLCTHSTDYQMTFTIGRDNDIVRHVFLYQFMC